MVLPAARARDEAHLYMDLHPCDRCGDVNVVWESSLADDDGVPARRYRGACGDCGVPREFVFALPERPVAPDADAVVFFGGAEPSRLLDPGEWLLVGGARSRHSLGLQRTRSSVQRSPALPRGPAKKATVQPRLDSPSSFQT